MTGYPDSGEVIEVGLNVTLICLNVREFPYSIFLIHFCMCKREREKEREREREREREKERE